MLRPISSHGNLLLPSGSTEPSGGGIQGAQLRLNWQKASALVDQVLRGPADEILADPRRAQCRLCRSTLSGQILTDEQVIANHRLVVAMDHAWSACEHFHEISGELRHVALARRQEVEELLRVLDQLRTEFPEQVRSYILRALAPSRERVALLRKQLQNMELEGLDRLPGISDLPPARRLGSPQTPPVCFDRTGGEMPELALHADGEWLRFCDSARARIDRIAPRACAEVAAGIPGGRDELMRTGHYAGDYE